MKRGRTITVDKSWEKWLDANCIGSAGPRPNITGMRNLYCGKDALLYRCGQYIYNMGKDTGQTLAR